MDKFVCHQKNLPKKLLMPEVTDWNVLEIPEATFCPNVCFLTGSYPLIYPVLPILRIGWVLTTVVAFLTGAVILVVTFLAIGAGTTTFLVSALARGVGVVDLPARDNPVGDVTLVTGVAAPPAVLPVTDSGWITGGGGVAMATSICLAVTGLTGALVTTSASFRKSSAVGTLSAGTDFLISEIIPATPDGLPA